MLKITENKFKLLGTEWTVLDRTDKGFLCVADSIGSKVFDDNSNDWRNSELRSYLNEAYLQKLEAEVGAENIIPFERDLLSLDGQTEYGSYEDKVSLLTVDEYRKYRSLLQNTGAWWWLITPWSTPCNGYHYTVAVVAPSGLIYGYDCNDYVGVRPFCIFNSSIFESEGK